MSKVEELFGALVTFAIISTLCFASLFLYLVGQHYPFKQWTEGEIQAFITLLILVVVFYGGMVVVACYACYAGEELIVDPQLIKLNEIVYPSSNFNFDQLQTEIQKLKSEELEIRLEMNQTQLTRLITNLQNKVDNDAKAIMDLYLQAHAQMIVQNKEDDTFAQAQLNNFENALQNRLTQEELQTLRTHQRETLVLEQHLNKLQGTEGRTRGTR